MIIRLTALIILLSASIFAEWKKADTYKSDELEVITYVKSDESLTKWSELLTIQTVNRLQVTPEHFFDLFITQLKTLAKEKNIESKITKNEPNEFLAEWWIDDKSKDSQYEWVKINQHDDSLQIIRFTTKNMSNLDAVRKKSVDVLKEGAGN